MSGSTPAARSLAECASGGLGHARVLPDSRCYTYHSGFLRVEIDRRQGEFRGQDPVARFVVEEGVEAADLDGHPKRAEFILVALEGALECSVAEMVVALDRLPDPALGKITA